MFRPSDSSFTGPYKIGKNFSEPRRGQHTLWLTHSFATVRGDTRQEGDARVEWSSSDLRLEATVLS